MTPFSYGINDGCRFFFDSQVFAGERQERQDKKIRKDKTRKDKKRQEKIRQERQERQDIRWEKVSGNENNRGLP